MTRHRVDGRTAWRECAPWIALGVVALFVMAMLASEAAWR